MNNKYWKRLSPMWIIPHPHPWQPARSSSSLQLKSNSVFLQICFHSWFSQGLPFSIIPVIHTEIIFYFFFTKEEVNQLPSLDFCVPTWPQPPSAIIPTKPVYRTKIIANQFPSIRVIPFIFLYSQPKTSNYVLSTLLSSLDPTFPSNIPPPYIYMCTHKPALLR